MLKIEFSISGTATQEIEILTGESNKEFFKKLKSGEYVTTLSGEEVINTTTLEVVGKISEQEISGIYTDFEKQ